MPTTSDPLLKRAALAMEDARDVIATSRRVRRELALLVEARRVEQLAEWEACPAARPVPIMP